MRLFLLVLALIFTFPFSLTSDQHYIPAIGYFLDVPAGWAALDASDSSSISFKDASGTAVLQVITLEGNSYTSASALCSDIKGRLLADGDSALGGFSRPAGTATPTGLFFARC